MIIGIAGNAGVGKDTCADYLVKNHGFVKVSLADPLKRICRDVFDFSEEQLWGPSEERNKPDPRYKRGVALSCGCVGDSWNNAEDYGDKAGWVGSIIQLCNKYDEHRDPNWVRGKVMRPTDDVYYVGEAYLTPRHALQQLGTEWGRVCYENVWVEYALRIAHQLMRHSFKYDAQIGLHTEFKPGDLAAGGVVIPDVRFKNEVDAVRAAGGTVWRVTRPIARLEGMAGQHQSETELDKIDPKLFHAFIDNSSTFEELYKNVEAGLTAQ